MKEKRERLYSVVRNTLPDRPPYSFWHHFEPGEASGEKAVDAHVRHFEQFDVDFLKVMNDNGYPRDAVSIIRTRDDLLRLAEYEGEEGTFELQLDLISELRSKIGAELPMITTVFSPWSVLRGLCGPEPKIHLPPSISAPNDEKDKTLSRLLQEDRGAVTEALQKIGRSLAAFAKNCLSAGADGIFLSVRDDWVDTEENGTNTYREIVRPADWLVVHASAGAPFNMLHVCGSPKNFLAFAEYPVRILNWADRYGGPSIAEVVRAVKPAVCAGVNNLDTLINGSPEKVAEEVRDALRQAGERPIIIAPGCTYDPERAPTRNLQALAEAAREAKYDRPFASREVASPYASPQ